MDLILIRLGEENILQVLNVFQHDFLCFETDMALC